MSDGTATELPEPRWLNRGVGAVGAASLLSDLGHEVPTSLLPSLLTSTIGAPAAALGLIEGVADGVSGAAKLAGGALADDPGRRRRAAVGGYVTTAVLSSAIGLATTAWQVGVLRTGAWAARGLRGPSRNALVADLVPAAAYGRAYGFERAMDNAGAIGGPLLALALVALVGTRTAILLSIVPGLLAAAAIVLAFRQVACPGEREHRPIRLQVRPVVRGRLGRLLGAITAFELGNVAVTLLVLRATDLLEPGRGHDGATLVALALYAVYNLSATLASVPAGHLGDRRDPALPLGLGFACFGVAYAGFAVSAAAVGPLALLFVLAGVGIALVETSESHAVAAHAPERARGSAFGLLAGIQSLGNLAASAVTGVLWTVASPTAAFAYLSSWMALALAGLAVAQRSGEGDSVG